MTAVPNLLTDPGNLYVGAPGSTLPANTVVGSKFTDTWPIEWIGLGATSEGSTFTYSTTVEPITVAEFLDPIAYRTTAREGSIAFSLADATLRKFQLAMNGGIAAIVATSGSGATALGSFEPPQPGSEVRVMVGWESLDMTLRFVAYQTVQGGEVQLTFAKAPEITSIPCTFNFEMPESGVPFSFWSAGAGRLG